MALTEPASRRPAEPDDLAPFDLFRDLPEAVVGWVAEHAERRIYDAGARVFEPGAPAEEMVLIAEGALLLVLEEEGRSRLRDTFRAPAVMGLLPYSRMTEYRAAGVASEPIVALCVAKTHFPEMMARSEELGRRLVEQLSDRVRTFTRGEQQTEKLAALGKLAAGLAHELNNPAAAIARTAADLRDRLGALPDLTAALLDAGTSPEALRDRLDALRARDAGDTLSALDRAEREDALIDALEAMEGGALGDACDLAASLVEAGVEPGDLDGVEAAVVPWLDAVLAAERLAGGIVSASGRISDLVASVKNYSHLDQAPTPEPADVCEGLASTLTMLGHAFRSKNVAVERDFADDLPRVLGLPGELNQVWTNLLDNALDAAESVVRVRAFAEGPYVSVEIEDDGPGIPEDVRPRLFEPFFTTKGVGEGTGLGLDVVRRIITQRHDGGLDVRSEPGRTVFVVRLPVAKPGAA